MPSKYTKRGKHSKAGLNPKPTSGKFSIVEEEFNWMDYKFTLGFVSLFAIIHAISILFFQSDMIFGISDQFIQLFAFNTGLVLNSVSEWYRFFTSLVIHGHLIHLAGNMLFFVIFSIRLEELKGWHIAFLIFFGSGIIANLFTLFFFGLFSNHLNFWSLGASGGVNGLFAATLVTMRKDYSKGSLSVLFFIIFFASFTLAGPNANFIAHLGGLIGGGLLMYVLEEYYEPKRNFSKI